MPIAHFEQIIAPPPPPSPYVAPDYIRGHLWLAASNLRKRTPMGWWEAQLHIEAAIDLLPCLFARPCPPPLADLTRTELP